MIENLGTANLFFLALWTVLSLGLIALYRPMKWLLRQLHPGQASKALLIILFQPLLASFMVVVMLYFPSLSGWLIGNHCHSMYCHSHPPLGTLPILGPASLVISAALILKVLRQAWVGRRANLRFNGKMRALCQHRGDFWALPESQPLALTAGLWWPNIILSEGILTLCNQREKNIVLLHEQSHCHNRDNLRLMLAHAFCLPLPGMRKLLGELSLLIEMRCDQQACRGFAREEVARCILKVAAAVSERQQAYFAFAEQAVESRVMRLLAPPREPVSLPAIGAACLLLLALVCASLTPLHHQVENLLAHVDHAAVEARR